MSLDQIRLPFLEEDNPFSKLNDKVNFRHNKDAALHRWVNWVAGFSAPFVEVALNLYISSNAKDVLVCDPFAGVGTTLLESIRKGYSAVGFEINPWSALAARTKLSSAKVDRDKLHRTIRNYDDYMANIEKRVDRAYSNSETNEEFLKRCSVDPASQPPSGFRSRIEFYSPPVLKKVLATLDFVKAIEDSSIRDLFRVAFGAEMVSFSNYTYEPSLGSRPGADKPLIRNTSVRETLMQKLLSIEKDIPSFWNGNIGDWEIVEGSFFDEATKVVQPNTVDLVVTSPPYLNNYHYVRNTRPHLYWLGFGNKPKDFKYLSRNNYGKFWQTVRDEDRIPLNFTLDSLEEQMDLIREVKKGNSTYGGNGWANYVATYFNDTKRFFDLLAQILKPNGHAVIVVGNSLIQGVNVNVPQLMGEIAPLCGLETEDIFLLQTKRTGTSIVRSGVRKVPRKEKVNLYEAAVILRRS